jgi:hypothetical protein
MSNFQFHILLAFTLTMIIIFNKLQNHIIFDFSKFFLLIIKFIFLKVISGLFYQSIKKFLLME